MNNIHALLLCLISFLAGNQLATEIQCLTRLDVEQAGNDLPITRDRFASLTEQSQVNMSIVSEEKTVTTSSFENTTNPRLRRLDDLMHSWIVESGDMKYLLTKNLTDSKLEKIIQKVVFRRFADSAYDDLKSDNKVVARLKKLDKLMHGWLEDSVGMKYFLTRDLTDQELEKVTKKAIQPKFVSSGNGDPGMEAARKSHGGGQLHRIPEDANSLNGVLTVDRKEFDSIIETGVPLGLTDNTGLKVILLYGSEASLPVNETLRGIAKFAHPSNLDIHTEEALENCNQLGVIHIPEYTGQKCWALLPGKESFHVQKWLRVENKKGSKINPVVPLRLVARGYDGNSGQEYPDLPNSIHIQRHRMWLSSYLKHVDEMVQELRPLVTSIAVERQLIVTVVNAGQSSLLINFACAARHRGLDVGQILVFVIDKELIPIVEELGMTPYYNEKFLGVLPSSDPSVFGNMVFTQIMVAKFMCTHLLSVMGYTFLFQDVDLIWYKHPMDFFNNSTLAKPHFDMYFQDDRNSGIRYQPMRGNSGFYFVRHNERTVAALKDAVLKTDQLYAARSHQQTLLEVLHEHVSYHGLRIKVYDGSDTEFFPLGEQFHRKKAFMKALMNGTTDAYLFHMNWTVDKKEKLDFLKQLGEWYVHDLCLKDDFLNQTQVDASNVLDQCCSAKPLFSCHYRDKPSIEPCHSSPAYHGNGKSWWS